jgi:hypothetical protein
MKYDLFLSKFKVNELKDIIRKYKLHVTFSMSGKKKDELIKHLTEHTDLVNNEIVIKSKVIIPNSDIEFKKKSIKIKNKEEGRLAGNIGRYRGLIDKLEEDLFYLNYNDTFYIPGRKGNMPKKDKDLKLIKKTKDELKQYKKDLKSAIEEFKKFK